MNNGSWEENRKLILSGLQDLKHQIRDADNSNQVRFDKLDSKIERRINPLEEKIVGLEIEQASLKTKITTVASIVSSVFVFVSNWFIGQFK